MGLLLWRCLMVILHIAILHIAIVISEDNETILEGRLQAQEAPRTGLSTQGTIGLQGQPSGFEFELLGLTNNNTGTTNVTALEIQTFENATVSMETTHFVLEYDTSTDRRIMWTDISDVNQVPNISEMFDNTSITSDDRQNNSSEKDTTYDELHFSLTDDSSGVPFLFHYILSPVVAIPGLVCNVFNIFVLIKQGLEDSTTSYLVALSVADLLFLAVNLLAWSFSLLKMFMYPVYVKCLLAMRFNFISRGLQITFGRISNLFVLVVSIERFIAVKFPLSVKFSVFVRHPAKIAMSVFALTFLIILPAWFTEEYAPGVDPSTNITQAIPVRSDIYKNNFGVFRVYSAFIIFAFRVLPVFLVLTFNLGIIVVLNNSYKTNVSNSSRHQKQLKITRMLVTIAAIFLICTMPTIFHVFATLNNPKYFTENFNLWVIVQSVFPFLDIVNSASNFFVYIVMSQKFRYIFLQYVFRGKPRTVQLNNVWELPTKPVRSTSVTACQAT